jgi:hypothetical protein
LGATFAVQTVAAMVMFGVAVVAPVAAPDIGVDATLIGTFTGIAYASGLGRIVDGGADGSLWGHQN